MYGGCEIATVVDTVIDVNNCMYEYPMYDCMRFSCHYTSSVPMMDCLFGSSFGYSNLNVVWRSSRLCVNLIYVYWNQKPTLLLLPHIEKNIIPLRRHSFSPMRHTGREDPPSYSLMTNAIPLMTIDLTNAVKLQQ